MFFLPHPSVFYSQHWLITEAVGPNNYSFLLYSPPCPNLDECGERAKRGSKGPGEERISYAWGQVGGENCRGTPSTPPLLWEQGERESWRGIDNRPGSVSREGLDME